MSSPLGYRCIKSQYFVIMDTLHSEDCNLNANNDKMQYSSLKHCYTDIFYLTVSHEATGCGKRNSDRHCEYLLRTMKAQAFRAGWYEQTKESLKIIKIYIRSTLLRPCNKVWSANDDFFLNLWWWWSASIHMRGVERLPRSAKDYERFSSSDNTACPTFSNIFSKNHFLNPIF